jgi:hypothetical protein
MYCDRIEEALKSNDWIHARRQPAPDSLAGLASSAFGSDGGRKESVAATSSVIVASARLSVTTELNC